MPDRKIAAMHKTFGKAWGYKCGDRPHLMRCGRHYKCVAYGLSASAATDWLRSWDACFLYNIPLPAGYVPLLDRIERRRRHDNDPLPGQMDMFGSVVTAPESSNTHANGEED